MTNDTITEKIQKLLALAKNNSNQNEIEIALRKAAKLMRDNNISEETLREIDAKQEEYILEYILDFNQSKVNWKGQFANTVAEHNFCKVFWTHAYNPQTKEMVAALGIFGKRKNVDATIFMYHNFISQLEEICEREFFIAKYKDSRIHGKSWKNSFFKGACNAMYFALVNQKNEFLKVATVENKKALAVIESELEREFKGEVGKLRKSPRQNNKINWSAFENGEKHAQNFSFSERLG